MIEGNPPPSTNQPASNPLSINIEFNINNSRGATADLSQYIPFYPRIIRGKKLDSDSLNLKGHVCACQVSKTPELAQTDRQTYSKEMEYLRPVEDRKKKSKRNSMDIQVPNRSINQLAKARFTKGNTTVLKKMDLSFKQDGSKKKRTSFKNDFQPYRKLTGQQRDLKSQANQSRSQKKTIFHKSLKNIIHKLVNNQLSKRSLTGITSNKVKSPYHTPNLTLNTTARKRNNKKKNLSCKSERGLGEHTCREEIVEKLNSLKSMTNSILRSEAEEQEMPYYSKQKGRIHIKTDQSIELIDQIAFYEKKTKRLDQRREVINKSAIDQTNKLIQTYIQLMNQGQNSSRQDDEESIQQYRSKFHNDFIEQVKENGNDKKQSNPTKIKDIISGQIKNLFSDQQEMTQELVDSGPAKQKLPEKSPNQTDKFRAFMSSEMQRPVTVSSQLQRMKLQQLKKQQIQKWGYLLQFIKKNMHRDEADTETVLNEVYWFLERSKNDLQRDLHADVTQQQNKEVDDDFTVKYSEKGEQNAGNYYVEKEEADNKEDDEVASFKEEYTEENEDLKLLSLETISSALKQRQLGLDRQRDREIAALEEKRQAGRVSQEEYLRQLQKIEKWNRKQLAQIKRAKKNIWKGYHEAKGVLDKTVNSRYYQGHENTKKMMKCLSQTYLKKPKIDYKTLLKREKSNQSSQSASSARISSDHSEPEQKQRPKQKKEEFKTPEPELVHDHSSSQGEHELSADLQMSGQLHTSQNGKLSESADGEVQEENRSQEMQEIKQRLQRMKREHYGMEEDQEADETIENNINYEEIERSLEEEYSDEEISLINREVGQSFLPTKNSEQEKFNKLQNKLKYCCSQDKEDIFEFIFLDLCIELYQQPCKDNKIMKAINDHVNRIKNQAKKKRGVKTNLNVVKEYLKRFAAFLLRTSKNCLQNLNIPMGPTALEMLRYMHDSDYDIPEEEEEVPTLIIPISVFDKFQQSLIPTLEFQEYYDDPEKEDSRINFLKTILHIHNKALFDSLNEFMDHERPFGIWGKPFPWKKSSSFAHEYSQSLREEKLKKSVDKVVEQCSYVCGLLVDKQESLVGNAKISQAYVEQIREDRLSRMLANELVESQERWLFYDDEETEVLVEISSYVWSMLLYEARNEIAALRRN